MLCRMELSVVEQQYAAAVSNRSLLYTRVRSNNGANHSQAPHVRALRWHCRHGDSAEHVDRTEASCVRYLPTVIFVASPSAPVVH